MRVYVRISRGVCLYKQFICISTKKYDNYVIVQFFTLLQSHYLILTVGIRKNKLRSAGLTEDIEKYILIYFSMCSMQTKLLLPQNWSYRVYFS